MTIISHSNASTAIPVDRDQVLHDWVSQRAARWGLDVDSLAPASSDASFRRYFRVSASSHGSLIVMDAPPGLEDCAPFVKVQALFAQAGLHVPQVIDADLALGFLLLEDLGKTPYLSALNADTAPTLYSSASQALVQLQTGTQVGVLPAYSAELLKREMELFREWYCGEHLGWALSDEERAMLDRTFAVLIANHLAQPQVYVHRDYHSRNLMVLSQDGPGVIDFQDAVMGPITYDLVSLLRDAYIRWEEEQQIDWVARYWERARQAQLPVNPDFAEFYRDFEWMGLQRHLKVLGIFARLWHRDGKDGYLKDIPRVLHYTRQCAERYAVFDGLVRLLDRLEGRALEVGYTF